MRFHGSDGGTCSPFFVSWGNFGLFGFVCTGGSAIFRARNGYGLMYECRVAARGVGSFIAVYIRRFLPVGYHRAVVDADLDVLVVIAEAAPENRKPAHMLAVLRNREL